VGFVPLAAFDTKEKKVYLNIKIDTEGTVSELRSLYMKSLSFAVEIGYASEDTIKFLIQKASMNEKSLEKFVKIDVDKIVSDKTENAQEVAKEEKNEGAQSNGGEAQGKLNVENLNAN